MPKMRIHEVAKMFGKSSNEVITVLRQQGFEVKSHMSTLTEENVEKIRPLFTAHKEPVKKEETRQVKTVTGAEKPASGPARKPAAPDKAPADQTARPVRSGEGGQRGPVRTPRPRPAEGRRPAENRPPRTGERPAENRPPRTGERPAENRPPRNRDGRRPADGSRPRGPRPAEGRRPAENRPPRTGERPAENRPVRSGERSAENRPPRTRDGRRPADGSRPRGPRPADGSADGSRPPRRNDGRGGRFQDRNTGDGRRSDRGNENFGSRSGDNRRTDNRGRRTPASSPDLGISTKESRGGNANRHEINREHSRDNNNRNNENRDGRGGRNSRRNNNNKNNNYSGGGNNQRNRKNQKGTKAPVIKPPKKQEPKEEVIRNITLPDPVSLKDLAEACKVAPSVIIKKLFLAGKMVTINTEFPFDDAAEIALEYNCIAEEEVQVDVIEELLKEEEEDESKMKGRPPVVCVMGHVDHGKTSLLDYIRSTQVTAGEAGGITQHIGAYVVDINGEKITFLDTPGHEAFTSMRLRGAQATDIAVLVVAADDGVMPQTIEAINHAKAAEVEVIVAINKIDKEGANIERVKQELTEYGLIAEDWGGSTVFVPVSAKTGEGIEELLEMITLTAEVLELKANPDRMARGLVIEAKLDKGRGSVATVLIQKGTLHVGDTISIGHAFGRVRAMIDDKGNRVQSAGPSVPVEILGLNEVPFSGEVMMAHATEKEARATAEAFIAYGREKLLEETKTKLSLDDLFDQIQAGNIKELNLVVKADVQGSVEAVRQSLMKLSNDEVMIKLIHGGVGAINESDVTLASASNAIIIGFNVRPDAQAKSAAEREKVDMRLYRVIYNAIEDIEAAMKGMLDPVFQEKVIGHLEIRQTYKASGVGTIAGCYVTDGMIQRNSQIRLVRDGIVIYEGLLASLKRFKDDVKEVKAGFECGCVFEKYNDIKEGDQVEAFVMEEIPR